MESIIIMRNIFYFVDVSFGSRAEYRNRPRADNSALQAEPMSDEDVENQNAVDDYYDLDNYDEEPVESGVSYNTDAMLLNSAPESEIEDDSDEDPDECTVKPDDNIIVAGHVSDDVCLLQLYGSIPF